MGKKPACGYEASCSYYLLLCNLINENEYRPLSTNVLGWAGRVMLSSMYRNARSNLIFDFIWILGSRINPLFESLETELFKSKAFNYYRLF